MSEEDNAREALRAWLDRARTSTHDRRAFVYDILRRRGIDPEGPEHQAAARARAPLREIDSRKDA